jgi:putative ABC transport system ATP-binding protein
MLKLYGVTKTYPGRNGHPVDALSNIDLTVTEGEFVTVVGPSGSGKSTLLFAIGAMLTPTAGEVVLNGANLYAMAAARRTALRRECIGFMFQTFNLVPYLSCLENVILPGSFAGKSRQDTRRRAADTLDRLGLSHRLSHRPSELSVGERQRVALCRSIINAPDLLLADEPTGNLDPAMTDEVHRLLSELNQEGQTIIVVTHDSDLAEVGTRVIHLVDGRLERDERHVDSGALRELDDVSSPEDVDDRATQGAAP